MVENQFYYASLGSLTEILKRTGLAPQKLAIENIEFPLKLTLDLVKEMGAKFCLDTAHLLGEQSGKYDLLEKKCILPHIETRNYLTRQL